MSSGVSSSNRGGIVGMRNRILNGDIRIDQANAGGVVSVASAASVHSVDKWAGLGVAAAGVFSLQRLAATPPAGFTHYLRATVTTADAAPAAARAYNIRQNIEGNYLQDFQLGQAGNNQFFTLGFWVRSSVAGLFSGAVGNSALNRAYAFTYAINAANTWEFKAVLVPCDASGVWLTDTGIGLRLFFDLGSGANNLIAAGSWQAGSARGATGCASLMATFNATLDLTGVQLEPGTAANFFEQRPFGDMLRLCCREYQKSFLLATAPAQNVGIDTGNEVWNATIAGANSTRNKVQFPVRMRAAPIITTYNPAAGNSQVRDETAGADCTGTTDIGTNEVGTLIQATGAAGTTVGGKMSAHWVADARL